ncbi:hypothetical protein [Paenibacillus sp. GCM10023250]|uniref:hypothetical protein n=1 Tax=Paenibacillus sp. GCM10023250 TaxID=3252648 RepID=UPI003607DBB2
MQHKRKVTKVAAVALMLSAFASPLAANAATDPLANYYKDALIESGEGAVPINVMIAAGTASADKNAKPIAVFKHPADPVALAKQYAPDTVEAWEQTLAQFDALLKDAAKTVTKTGQDGKPMAIKVSKTDNGELKVVGPISPDQLKVIKVKDGAGVAVKAIPAIPADGAVLVKDYAGVPVKAIPADPAEGGGKVTVQLKDGVPLPAGVKLETLQAVAIDNSFVKGQLALSKSADSKDADAIKKALAALLGLYQDEIAKLQQQQQEQAGK